MTTSAHGKPIDSLPSFPIPRLPFGPPEQFREFQQDPWLTPVRMWNGRRAWLVTRLDDVRALLADHRFSANPTAPGFPTISEGRAAMFYQSNPSFTRMDGAEHARLRKMITAEFTLKRVDAWRPIVEDVVNDVIDRILRGPKPVNFVKSFAMAVSSNILARLLGVPEDDQEIFQDCTIRLIDVTQPPEVNIQADKDFRAYIRKIVDQKIADASSDDLLSRLIRDYYQQGAVSYDEVIATAQLVCLAGHDTTGHTLSLSTILLLLDPKAYAALGASDDPAFIRNAVEEVLRYTSVAQFQCARVAMEEVEYRGHVIRKGEGILSMVHAANRDPAHFDDPDRFDIFRTVKVPHVAFGFGPHQCLAQALARLELSVALTTLARRMPGLRLHGSLGDVIFRGDALIHGIHNMMVTW